MPRPRTAAFVVLAFLVGCARGRGPETPRDLARIELHADDVVSVKVRRGGDSGSEVSLDVSLTPEARRRLEEFTAVHVGEQVAILVDGEVVMEPELREPIADGHLEISGPSEDELRDMGERMSEED